MIVSQEQYEKMKEVVAKIVQEGRNVKVADCSQVQCDFEALVSLLSQALVRQNKFSNSSRQMILKKLEAGQREGVSLLNLSHQVGIGSYRTAKFVVESILGSNCSVSQIVENPDLITDEWIRREVLECILHDPSCSVDTTLTQECVGREYEVLLMQQLRSRNMCFETEAELRNRGKPKTPDILLLIPMGVIDYRIPIESNRISGVSDVPRISTSSSAVKQNVSTIAEGTQQQQRHYVINWIDSKAMFADEETFEGNYEQLKGYVNRYGAGMVIYWHGFVQSLTRLNDENIFISDKFPEHWIFPSGELADGSVPEFDTLVCKRDCTGVGCTCSNCTGIGCTGVDCTGEG